MEIVLVYANCLRTAYDDTTSTFTVKQGAGFEVVFCPSGRSTNIQKSLTT